MNTKTCTNFNIESLVVGEQSLLEPYYNETGISIASNGTTDITITDFFYPTTRNPLEECGVLTIMTMSNTLESCGVANFGYVISRNGTSRSGAVSTGYGLSKTDGDDVVVVKSGDDLVITMKLTSTADAVSDGEIRVLKSKYFDSNENTKVLRGEYTEYGLFSGPPLLESLVVGDTNYTGVALLDSGSFTGGSAIDLDIPSFFNDTNTEIGEVIIRASGNVRKIGRLFYTNFNTNRALSEITMYASAEPGGGGGGIYIASIVGTTLRLNIDFTSGPGSGTGFLRATKNVFWQN